MSEWENLGDRIDAEYDKVTAFIAKRPKLSVLIASIVFFVIGAWFF